MELIAPTVDLHASWLEAFDEDEHAEGHGMRMELARGVDLRDPRHFAAWVQALRAEEHTPAPGAVTASNLWVCHGGEYLGAIQLRHELGNEALRTRGGHVGYTVRPSARGQGVATWALLRIKEEARKRDLPRLLITCTTANAASARVIEKAGGVYESTFDGMRRYWVELK